MMNWNGSWLGRYFANWFGLAEEPVPPTPPDPGGGGGGGGGGRRRFGPDEEINRSRQRRFEMERAKLLNARDKDELEMILTAWLNLQ